VIFSTIFTLFVIPVVYTMLDRLSLSARRERKTVTGPDSIGGIIA